MATVMRITPIDDSKVEEGVWTEYLGVKLRIARTTSQGYVNALIRKARKFRNKVHEKMPPTKEMTDAVCEAIADHILLDWQGLKIGDKEVEYSKENALALMEQDIDCRNYVIEFADDMSNFLQEEVEHSLGK